MEKTIVDESYEASSVGGGLRWYTFRCLVVENSTNTLNNSSNVTVTHYGKYNYSGTGFTGYQSPKSTIKVDGVQKVQNTVSSLDSNWKVLSTWTGDIKHDDNGKKTSTFDCLFEANSSVSYLPGTNTIGGIGVMTDIPRYGTSNQSLKSKTETSITMNWSSDSTVDYIWYSINNGSSWTGVDVADGSSGSYTINNLTANTVYNIKTRIRRKDSQLTTDSSVLSVTTYDYPYCTSSPDFTIENAVTLTFYNPLGRTMNVTLIGKDNKTIGSYTGTATSVTGFNSSNDISNQYASIPNDQESIYSVQVVYSSSTKTRNNGNKYSINKNNCMPTFSLNQLSYISNLTDLTDSNKTVIKGKSTVTITVNTEATAKNSATIKSYSFNWNGKTASISSLGSASLTGGTTNNVTVAAIDSRNLQTSVTLTFDDFVNYSNVSIDSSSKAEREDGINQTVILSLKGKCYYDIFGQNINAKHNKISKVDYFISTNQTFENTPTGTLDISKISYSEQKDNLQTFSTEEIIYSDGASLGFTIGIQYYVKLHVYDGNNLLGYTTYELTITDGKIARDVYKDNAGNYHSGVNGMADNKYTETIHGNLNVTEAVYIAGKAILDYEIVDEW